MNGSVTVRGYDDDYNGDDANAFTIYSHTSSYFRYSVHVETSFHLNQRRPLNEMRRNIQIKLL